jgi:hypothetical protein
LKSLACFRESRLAGQDEAEIHKCLGVLRIVLDRLPEQLLRFSGIALLAIQVAEVVLRLRILPIELHCFL